MTHAQKHAHAHLLIYSKFDAYIRSNCVSCLGQQDLPLSDYVIDTHVLHAQDVV